MKKLLPLLCCFFLSGCANLTPGQQAMLNTAEGLAKAAVQAAAAYYGGPAAGELAGAGLSAVADVLQGYVGGQKPSVAVIAASPGVKGLAGVAIKYLESKNIITQATVNSIHKAAAITADVTASP